MTPALSDAVRRGLLILADRTLATAAERTGPVIRWNPSASAEELEDAVRAILAEPQRAA